MRDEIGSYVLREVKGNGIHIKASNGEMRIIICSREIVRVQVWRGEGPKPNPALPERSWGLPSFELKDEEDHLEITTSSIRLKLRKSPLRFDLFSRDGHPINLDADGIRFEGGVTKISRRAEEDEDFFGFGLQFHSFNHRGKLRFLKVTADPKEDNGQSHVVVPFFLSSRGYGILVNTHLYSTFQMAEEENPDTVVISTPGDSMDLFMIYGPLPRQIVARYVEITGPPAIPPKWGLGFWYRMKSGWKEDKIRHVAEEFRRRGIPCDVIGLEPSWQTHAYSCSYVWNKSDFPDPDGLIEWLHERGFRLNLWEHAYVHPSSPIYEEIKPHSADREVWGGLVPDFTADEARRVFTEYHEREFVRKGVDGFKLDECDGSDFTGGWFFPDETKFPGGLKGSEMHNIFGFLYQDAIHSVYRKANRRTYLLCRGNFTGSHRYATCAYSDLYGFREYLRALVNSGFTMTLWCPEVRKTSSAEEFIRRAQLMFLSPLAMINAWADGITPWRMGKRCEGIFRRYAEMRMRLLPYIYSAFWRAREEGVPVIRPLYLDFPDDPTTRSLDDQYMFGDSMMIAPVIQKGPRNIHLPPGRWIDFWSGDIYEGPDDIEYEVPIDLIPIFVRAGAVVPMGPTMNHIGERHEDELTLLLYPGGEGRFTLYEDDGVSFAYERGEVARTYIHHEEREWGWRLSISAADGIYAGQPASRVIRVERQGRKPVRVELDGAAVPKRGELKDELGWSYDPTTGTLKICCGRVPVTRSCEIRASFDEEGNMS